jgi:inward rectifier potassium channel
MGKQNLKIKEEKDSGFSTIVSGRFTNKDGRYNVKRKGVNILNRYSWFLIILIILTI